MVYPNEVAVEAEGMAFDAGRVRVLALDADGFDAAAHAAAGVTVIGALAMNYVSAGFVARETGAARAAGTTREVATTTALDGNEELATATVGNPDGVTIETEGAAFHASGAGDLADEANIADAAIYETAVGAAIGAGTGDHLLFTAAGAPPIRATGAKIIFASPGATIIVAEAVTGAKATWAKVERVLRLRAEAEE